MYYATLLARTDDGWQASEAELDDVETLDDLTDLARAAAADEETVLVCLEQDGVWFGVVRVDGEDDPRIYVSDAAAAMRSAYGEMLISDELLDLSALDQLVDLDGTEEGEPESDDPPGADDQGEGADQVPPGPLGDTEILSDLGMAPRTVLTLTVEDALAEIAEALGCSDLLESVR